MKDLLQEWIDYVIIHRWYGLSNFERCDALEQAYAPVVYLQYQMLGQVQH